MAKIHTITLFAVVLACWSASIECTKIDGQDNILPESQLRENEVQDEGFKEDEEVNDPVQERLESDLGENEPQALLQRDEGVKDVEEMRDPGQAALCPSSHPFAYFGGSYCCKYNREKHYRPQGALCDGSIIGLNSKCCRYDAHTKCPAGKNRCKNYQRYQAPLCPLSHPFAYFGGSYCCKYGREKVYQPQGALCDGSLIGFNSKCCRSDAYTNCPAGKKMCSNSGIPFIIESCWTRRTRASAHSAKLIKIYRYISLVTCKRYCLEHADCRQIEYYHDYGNKVLTQWQPHDCWLMSSGTPEKSYLNKDVYVLASACRKSGGET